MTAAAPQSRGLTALTHLVRTAVKPPSAVELGEGLSALRARTEPRAANSPPRLLGRAIALALAVAGLMGWLGLPYLRSHSSWSERPVAVTQVHGGELLYGGYLSETGGSGVQLSLNDGSSFDLEPGSRGRLRLVDAEGTRFSLEQGTLTCHLSPTGERGWSVDAGPFVVTGQGSVVYVVWDPANEYLEVTPRWGRVRVRGSLVGDEVVLRPDQTLSVSLPRRQTVITEGSRSSHPTHLSLQ